MPAGSDDGVLDGETMDALLALNHRRGGTLLPAMIHAFIQQECPEALAELERARANGDVEAVAKAAHKLRGSAAAFGAVRVSRLCADIEIHSRAANLLDAAQLADSLRAEVDEAIRQLGRYT